MSYEAIGKRLNANELIVTDGATGAESERRGVLMDAQAWSVVANL